MEFIYIYFIYLLCWFFYYSLYLIYIINCYDILNIYICLYKCIVYLYNLLKRIKLVINKCVVCKKKNLKENKIKKKIKRKKIWLIGCIKWYEVKYMVRVSS